MAIKPIEGFCVHDEETGQDGVAKVSIDAVQELSDDLNSAVESWLDEHSEVTTTVQDGAISEAKMANNAVGERSLIDGAVSSDKMENTPLYVHMVKGSNANSDINLFGDCTVVHGEKNGLIDLGADPDCASLIEYLRSKNIDKLDFVIISHFHSDHVTTNIATALGSFDEAGIDYNCTWYLPHKGIDWTKGRLGEKTTAQNFYAVMADHNLTTVEPTNNSTVQLGENLSVRFLNTNPAYYNQYYYYYIVEDGSSSGDITIYNNFSMIAILEHYGHKFVFTGDIHETAERLNAGDLDGCDVYKVEHHALNAKTDPQWLGAINPKYAMVGAYSDNYNDEVLVRETTEKLLNSGCELLCTADSAITIYSDRFSLGRIEGVPFNVRHGQNGSAYYQGEVLTKEHFNSSYLTDGLIDIDKMKTPGKYYSPNAASSRANIKEFDVLGKSDFWNAALELEVRRTTINKDSVVQTLSRPFYGEWVYAFRKYNDSLGAWNSWQVLTGEAYAAMHASDDLTALTQPTVYGNRIRIVKGGYTTYGKFTTVDVIFENVVDGYAFGAGTYVVATGLPTPSSGYIEPLSVCAAAGDANTSKVITAYVSGSGGLALGTSAALGNPSTATTFRVKGTYKSVN